MAFTPSSAWAARSCRVRCLLSSSAKEVPLFAADLYGDELAPIQSPQIPHGNAVTNDERAIRELVETRT
jgi:hypothetical protein